MTIAEDLKNGDIFIFRDVEYICLLSFTDDRHSQTIVTAVELHSDHKLDNIHAMRFLRKFKVKVKDHDNGMKLTVHHNTNEELENAIRS